MESDQPHVPAVFRHFIPLRERLVPFSVYRTDTVFSSFFEQSSSQQFQFSFVLKKTLNWNLQIP